MRLPAATGAMGKEQARLPVEGALNQRTAEILCVVRDRERASERASARARARERGREGGKRDIERGEERERKSEKAQRCR